MIHLSVQTHHFILILTLMSTRAMSLSSGDTARLTASTQSNNNAEKSLSQILLTTCVGSKVVLSIRTDLSTKRPLQKTPSIRIYEIIVGSLRTYRPSKPLS